MVENNIVHNIDKNKFNNNYSSINNNENEDNNKNDHSNIEIIKIGGSLTYEVDNLLNTLKKYVVKSNKKIIIIPGGGDFANVVRAIYEKTSLNNEGAHLLAVKSTDLIGHYFSEISNISTVDNLYCAKKILNKENIVIFLPSKLILSTDELPKTWDLTSDSICAYVAKYLNLNRIIIATNVNGIYTTYPKGKLLYTINAKALKDFTSVDKYLSTLLVKHHIECFVVNGKYPQRIINILNNISDIYTKISLND